MSRTTHGTAILVPFSLQLLPMRVPLRNHCCCRQLQMRGLELSFVEAEDEKVPRFSSKADQQSSAGISLRPEERVLGMHAGD